MRKKNREVYVKIIRRFSSVKNTTLYFKIMYKSVNDKSGSSEKGKEIVYKVVERHLHCTKNIFIDFKLNLRFNN